MSKAPLNSVSDSKTAPAAQKRPVSTFPGPWSALPARALWTISFLAPILGYALYVLVVWLMGVENAGDLYLVGLYETGIVILPAVAYLAIIRPHHQRPVSLWVMLWMVGTILRMMLTLVISLLVYFATDFNQLGVFGSFLISWFFLLTGETWVCASHLRGVQPRLEAVQPMEPA